ncbi:hypothetical protein EDB84DRAFT_1445095 [Lactarius hengduanensis]|nr:hypothetical protein EDB84DRAFT_1445095 [Lactarius hengduanensis]
MACSCVCGAHATTAAAAGDDTAHPGLKTDGKARRGQARHRLRRVVVLVVLMVVVDDLSWPSSPRQSSSSSSACRRHCLVDVVAVGVAGVVVVVGGVPTAPSPSICCRLVMITAVVVGRVTLRLGRLDGGGGGGRGSSGPLSRERKKESGEDIQRYELSTIDLKAVIVETASDPDHPNVPKSTKHSTKQARTGVAMIKVIQQNEECLRRLFATYLNDQAPDALYFTTKWCCDRHPGSDFRLCTFFKGRLLYQDPDTSGLYYGGIDESDREEILPPLRKKRKAGVKVRATNERAPLTDRLIAWRLRVHDSDPLASVRPPTFILNDSSIKKLSRLHPAEVTGPEKMVSVLGETQEWQANWSGQVYEIIRAYDQELEDLRKKEAARHKARQKRVKQDQDTAKFAEESNLTEERIRQEVLQRHRAAVGLGGTLTMREALDDITENIPVRRSTRLQNLK